MNWYKKYKYSGKTYRDNRDYVQLYHASPEKINVLRPFSSFGQYKGMYMTNSLKSIYEDWGSYVLGKKHHTLVEEKRKEILTAIDKIEHGKEYKKAADPSQQQTLDNLWEELHKINDVINRDSYRKGTEGYKTIYIHKILCPKNIYNKCLEIVNQVFDAGYMKDKIGFWMWGPQIFIPEQYLKNLEIISVNELSKDEFLDQMYGLSHGRRVYKQPSLKLSPEKMKKFEEEEKLTSDERKRKQINEEKELKIKRFEERQERIRKHKKEKINKKETGNEDEDYFKVSPTI